MTERLQGGVIAGGTDLRVSVLLRNTSNNQATTGKTYSDVTASYWREGGIRVDIPAVTLAAVDSAHSDGGFIEVDGTNMPGLYRFDTPDEAIAVGADWVIVTVKVAGAYVFHKEFDLTGNQAKDIQTVTDKLDNMIEVVP